MPEQQRGPDDLLTSAQVRRWLQVSQKTLHRKIAEGKFPPPTLTDPERWRWGDLCLWLEYQRIMRPGAAPNGPARTTGDKRGHG